MMGKFKILGRRVALTLFAIFTTADASVILQNDLLKQEICTKINQIGDELYQKTGITVGLVAINSLDGATVKDKEREFALKVKSPYAILFLTKKEQKVDILASEDVLKLFDKEQVLSPYPNSGTILPILTSKEGKDIYNAALLNGYADIAEQIAASKGIKLQSSIGSANKIVLQLMRYLIYGSVLSVILILVGRNLKDKYAKQKQ